MAAMAAAQTATITPPSSDHGEANGFQWDFATAPAKQDTYHQRYDNQSTFSKIDAGAKGTYRAPLSAHNGNAVDSNPRSAQVASMDQSAGGALEREHSYDDDPMADDSLDNDDHGRGRIGVDGRKRAKGQEWSDEDSKWIHRDKLAKIESEELQAAGFILPGPRSRSRPRRERSQSQNRAAADGTRKQKDLSLDPNTPDAAAATNGWANEGDDDQPARPTTGSRIPVPKKSPAQPRTRESSPEELEKNIDTSKARSRSNSITLKGLDPSANSKPQPVKRAGTDASPPKKVTPSGTRKASAPAKSIPPEARGKPKPKNKSATNGNSSTTRPSTRDGLRDSSTGSLGPKQMEGEPPWMINAYKPDPRLPPDQQLLPTVARRLAQEKWEQEGKFGNIYDKDFRPLTDEGYGERPAGAASPPGDNVVRHEVETQAAEWPLKSPEPPEPKSPASLGRSSTYSTMPRIQDKLQTQSSPLPSPRPQQMATVPPPPQVRQVTRVADVEEKEPQGQGAKGAKKKEGCGCCIVM